MITLLLCLALTGTHAYEPDNIMGVVTINDYYPTNKKEFGTGYNTVTLQRTESEILVSDWLITSRVT